MFSPVCLLKSSFGSRSPIVRQVKPPLKKLDLALVSDCVEICGKGQSFRQNMYFYGLSSALKSQLRSQLENSKIIGLIQDLKQDLVGNVQNIFRKTATKRRILVKKEIAKAASIGVKLVCSPNEVAYARRLNKTLEKLHELGVELPKRIKIVPPQHPLWRDEGTYGIFSICAPEIIRLSPHRNIASTFIHELGHYKHYKACPGAFVDLCGAETLGELSTLAYKCFDLSYAARRPREFVAEFYRWHLEGKLPKGSEGKKLIEYYYRLGGAELPLKTLVEQKNVADVLAEKIKMAYVFA